MKSIHIAEIIKNQDISENIYDMTILVPEIAKEAKAGQFINVYTGKGEYILPRPISICGIDEEKGTIRMVFQVVGKGTELFSALKAGDTVKVLGPLGNGYDISEKYENNVLIGGGIGVPPLLELAKRLEGKKYVFIGARTNPILVDEFKALGAEVYVATDDGSEGFKGNAVQLVREINPAVDAIYSCGPKIMLKAVADWAEEKGIKAQVSMEERMACGIGACVGCAVKIKKEGESDWSNLKVCKDGPVFLSNEVVWNE